MDPLRLQDHVLCMLCYESTYQERKEHVISTSWRPRTLLVSYTEDNSEIPIAVTGFLGHSEKEKTGQNVGLDFRGAIENRKKKNFWTREMGNPTGEEIGVTDS